LLLTQALCSYIIGVASE